MFRFLLQCHQVRTPRFCRGSEVFPNFVQYLKDNSDESFKRRGFFLKVPAQLPAVLLLAARPLLPMCRVDASRILSWPNVLHSPARLLIVVYTSAGPRETGNVLQ